MFNLLMFKSLSLGKIHKSITRSTLLSSFQNPDSDGLTCISLEMSPPGLVFLLPSFPV
jgi:hypothetical protein